MTIRQSNCWACGSPSYTQTAAVEHCPACGIRCDYHGGGANAAYDTASARKHGREEREREAAAERQRIEEWGE